MIFLRLRILLLWALTAFLFLISFGAEGEFAAFGTAVVGGLLIFLILISSINVHFYIRRNSHRFVNAGISQKKIDRLKTFSLVPIILALPILFIGMSFADFRSKKPIRGHLQSASDEIANQFSTNLGTESPSFVLCNTVNVFNVTTPSVSLI